MKKLLILLVMGFFLLPGRGWSQLDIPPSSPEGFIRQKVGVATVEVTYSRPSMRGRVIFGDLVPYNEIWRTGANASTKLHFSDDVTLENHKVPAGMYALYTIPGEKEWTVILSNNTELWGTYGYVESDDFLRFKVTPVRSPYHFETFTIDVGELTETSATLQLMWENTVVRINLGTRTDEKILAQIEEKLKNPMVHLGNNYYAAANYYLRTHRDMDKALEWINKAIEINGSPIWYMSSKAEILAEMGNYRDALKVANEAIDKAKKEEQGYVTMLEKSSSRWKKMLNN